MQHKMSVAVAEKTDAQSALVAQTLYDNDWTQEKTHAGRTWTRASRKMLTGVMPYLTVHKVRTALRKLKGAGIVTQGELNDSRFDRTAWYSFTNYGQLLMTQPKTKPRDDEMR
jgi:hypothetical protein